MLLPATLLLAANQHALNMNDLQAVMRVGTHNVRHLRPQQRINKLNELKLVWNKHQLDIVLLQEVWPQDQIVNFSDDIASQLHGWTCYFNKMKPGTAILIRRNLIATGAMQNVSAKQSNDGRYTVVTAKWGGHKLHIASLYLPSGDQEAQKLFIQNKLRPLYNESENFTRLWGGDYNFDGNPSLDRITRVNGVVTLPKAIDTPVNKFWKHQLSNMVDIYRHQHPTSRLFTRFSGNGTGAARLDRFYTDKDSLQYFMASSHTAAAKDINGHHLSDHLLVTIRLAAKHAVPIVNAPRRTRLRLWFTKVEALTEDFKQWLLTSTQEDMLPTEDIELLRWWWEFKKQIVAKVKALNQVEHARRHPFQDQSKSIYEGLFNINWNSQAGRDQATALLDQYSAAATAATEHEKERRIQEERDRDRFMIHNRERPCPHFTDVIRPRKKSGIVAIRNSNGTLISHPVKIAKVITRKFASVSEPPVVSTAAQQQVLQAIQQSQPQRLSATANEAIGAAELNTEAIKKAIVTSKPGTEPGRDGIPIEVYQRFQRELVPVLQKVYSAIGRTKRLPRGFLEGVIACLYKSGEIVDAGNYRPITLLNTDYRILAKVLAQRLAPHLHEVIDKSQSAFVPGRHIGNNIMMIQAVADRLKLMNKSAVVAFCDFRKAYDTIDRGFLLQIMKAMGVEQGFLDWVELLLTNTRAGAMNQGYIAPAVPFQAGVRQGCPLAPLLYLFIGQALWCLLRAHDLGVKLNDNATTTSSQFADDLEAFLTVCFRNNDFAQVEKFKELMGVFAEATGQHLNIDKTYLLPIGKLPVDIRGSREPLPEEIAGFQVKLKAKALGVFYEAGDATTSADWPSLQERMKTRCTKIAGMGLSMFGRAFSVAAYVSSTLLYHAEFCDIPPTTLDTIQRWVAKLIDRKQAPGATTRRFPGIKSEFLALHPRVGGVGSLPLIEHIAARRAAWGLKLIGGEVDHPWAAIASKTLELAMSCGCRKSSTISLLCAYGQEERISGLPPYLKRIIQPMLKLPPLIVASDLEAGEWCYAAPIWDNPLIPAAEEMRQKHARLLCTNIKTVGDLLHRIKDIEDPANWGRMELPMSRPFLPTVQKILGYYAITLCTSIDDVITRDDIRDMLYNLKADIPVQWIQAAEVVVEAGGPRPSIQEFQQKIMDNMGWSEYGISPSIDWKHWHQIWAVKWATERLVEPQQEQVRERFDAFAAAAGFEGTAGSEQVLEMLRRLWKLPIRNKHKEILWRLVHNGIPTAERMHKPEMKCGCGAVCPDINHHYWECIIARTLRILIEDCLGDHLDFSADGMLEKDRLWLCNSPSSDIHQGVWDAVCLAALGALETARKHMTKEMLYNGIAPGNRQMIKKAQYGALSMFWKRLIDFKASGLIPSKWKLEVSRYHPFLKYDLATDSIVVAVNNQMARDIHQTIQEEQQPQQHQQLTLVEH